jgi:Ca-activated chloride channel homolog
MSSHRRATGPIDTYCSSFNIFSITYLIIEAHWRLPRFCFRHISSSSGALYLEIDLQHKNTDISSLLMAGFGKCPAVKAPAGVELFSCVVPSGRGGDADIIIAGKSTLKTAFQISIGSENISITAESSVSGDVLPTLWASLRLSSLYSDAQTHSAHIISISQQFGIPTSLTRLLLITETSDFYSVGIPPPAGKFYCLKSYNDLMSRKDSPGEDKSSPQWYFWKDNPYKSSSAPEPQRLMDKWDWTYRREENIKVSDFSSSSSIRSILPKRVSPVLDYEDELTPVSSVGSVLAPPKTPFKKKVISFDLDSSYFPKGPFQYRVCRIDENAAYIAELKSGKNLESIKTVYHRHLNSQKGSVAFHFDVAWDALHLAASSDNQSEARKFALHVLYNVFELNLKEKTHWRSMAYLLEAFGFDKEALMAYERAWESQDWMVERRELAVALIKFGGAAHYQRALNLFETALKNYYGDDHIDFVMRVEYNALVARCKVGNVPLVTNPLIADKANKNVEADIRILLSWDSADAAVGLFVQEPDGYIVYHKDSSSPCGGFLTNHVREGWGPEQYAMVKAVPGKYRAFARIAERDNGMTREKLLFCRVYFNWARTNQTEHCFVIRPENSRHLIVAEFEIPEGRGHFQTIQVSSGGLMPNGLPFIQPKWPKDGHF